MDHWESVDDPLLKELLGAFREDSQNVAQDILRGIWVQAAISLVALFLAVSSTVRLILSIFFGFPGGPGPGPGPAVFAPDIALTIILFVLSVLSLRSFLILRTRYSRLSTLAEKLGR